MKFNFNFLYTIKRLEDGGERVTNEIVTVVEDDLEIPTLDSIVGDSFFTKIKSKLNKKSGSLKKDHVISKLELNNQVSEFRNHLQKEIIQESNRFLKETNFTSSQVKTLKDFLKNKPFKILACDKNIGNALIDKKYFLKLAFEFIKNDPSYSELKEDPLLRTTEKINFLLDKLFIEADISIDIRDALKIKPDEVKMGNFKLLAKLHKKEFGWRPIINSIGHPTSKICFLIDKIFQPFVLQTDSYLKDSQNLIQKCETLEFENPPHLYSLDFSSLYSNINPTLAIPTLAEFLTPRIKAKNFTIKALVTLLKIIFNFNIFKFEKKFFVQNKGLAMGCICGPSVANLYLHILEKSLID